MTAGRTAGLTVSVDRGVCVSSGNCAASVPEVFDQDDVEGVVILRDEQPPHELHERVEMAEQLCPVRAIQTRRN